MEAGKKEYIFTQESANGGNSMTMYLTDDEYKAIEQYLNWCTIGFHHLTIVRKAEGRRPFKKTWSL